MLANLLRQLSAGDLRCEYSLLQVGDGISRYEDWREGWCMLSGVCFINDLQFYLLYLCLDAA